MKTVRWLVFLLTMVVLGISCSRDNSFGIYLLKGTELPGSQGVALETQDEPFIATHDIVVYERQTHRIELTEPAFARLMGLQVPVSGRPFAVSLGREVIYTGNFWTPVSSISSPSIIMKPLDSEGRNIQIDTGYPSAEFFEGKDPRSDVRLMGSLEKAGKLR